MRRLIIWIALAVLATLPALYLRAIGWRPHTRAVGPRDDGVSVPASWPPILAVDGSEPA